MCTSDALVAADLRFGIVDLEREAALKVRVDTTVGRRIGGFGGIGASSRTAGLATIAAVDLSGLVVTEEVGNCGFVADSSRGSMGCA